MKTIVIGTDFSPNSIPAIDYGLAIARRLNSSVHLVHISSPDMRVGAVTAGDLASSMLDDCINRMRELSEKYRNIPENKAIEIQAHCLEGSPADTLLDHAKTHEADLIITGTLGSGNLANMLLGSTAQKLARKSTTPLLVIPAKRKFEGLARITWARDWVWEDEYLAEQLLTFASFFQATLDVVTIWPRPDDEPLNVREIHEQLMSKLKYDRLTFHFEENSNPTEAISDYALDTGSDLVAIVSRKRNWLERLLDKGTGGRLIADAELPLLIFYS